MRFLVDNAVSPIVSACLAHAGHDSVHVRERGLQAASDDAIMDLAVAENRIVVSADTDFGMLLAQRHTNKPSIILFRHGAERRPDRQAALLLANLLQLETPLDEGVLVTIEPTRIRIRVLPLP